MQRLILALLAQRLGRMLYDPYSRRRDELTAQLISGGGTVGRLSKEMGPAPPLRLPIDDPCVRLSSQICLLANVRPCFSIPVNQTTSSTSPSSTAIIDEIPALDEHFVRNLLPKLMVHAASIRFVCERSEVSKHWIDLLSKAKKGIRAAATRGTLQPSPPRLLPKLL